MPEGSVCLLIGNSRWHWARYGTGGWTFDHSRPSPESLDNLNLLHWAAVGPIPPHSALAPSRRIELGDVPLPGSPPWLGVDRALAGWAAWRAADLRSQGGVLVADAGTVLSLTRVDADGVYAGGQLAAGFSLQLRAMAEGTCNLPPSDASDALPEEFFPQPTLDAMRRGAVQSLVGLLLEAQHHCRWPLWLCGGDAPLLIHGLHQRGGNLVHAPNLVMEGMVALIS
ncbi:MAG: type III pantothenate kinase [Synechococcus sp.]|nr:type III pantothenate kinase [Synechococcus sp.]